MTEEIIQGHVGKYKLIDMNQKEPRANNVVRLPCVTTLDLNPDVILEEAVGKLETVVLLGYDHDGGEYFASSVADGGTVMWLMEKVKKQLLEVCE